MILPVPVQPDASELVIVLLLAYVLDIVVGEPPFAVHPVVWMGRLIGFFKKNIPAKIAGFMEYSLVLQRYFSDVLSPI